MDRYVTLAGRSEARIKVERSEFLGIALPADDLAAFLGELASAEKTYFDATHHCWAYRPFSGPERSSDAGEPHGSAGKPIAQAISGAALHNVGVVVVRWYGGVKLGTGGLSRAYGQAAADALRAGVREEHFIYERIEVEVPFARISDAYRLVAPPDVLLAGQDFGDRNVFSFDVRASLAEGFRKEMVEKRLAILP